MAVLWERSKESGEWVVSRSGKDERGAADERRTSEARTAADRSAPFRLVDFAVGAESRSALVAPLGEHLFVNGARVLGGLKILEHRDEILARGRRYYYSSHALPVVSRFQLGPDMRRPKCPVCRDYIDDGASVVLCPQCGKAFHQAPAPAAASSNEEKSGEENGDGEKRCWTYREQCLCRHPTALEAASVWRPEQEEGDE